MKQLILLFVCGLVTANVCAGGFPFFRSSPSSSQQVKTGIIAKNKHLENTLGGSVSRAMFTRAVVNREPIDTLTEIKNNLNHVYFFSEIKGLMGETVFHRWEFNGEVVAEKKFQVGGPRWRVWSSQVVLPDLIGEWKVYVLDMTGRIIREAIFNYVPLLAR